jgi:intracellular septation protein A
VILASVMLSRRASLFLLAVAVWNWVIWPTFLRNIWADDRSFDGGPTAFLLVHLVLVVVSLLIGGALGALGWRGLRAR